MNLLSEIATRRTATKSEGAGGGENADELAARLLLQGPLGDVARAHVVDTTKAVLTTPKVRLRVAPFVSIRKLGDFNATFKIQNYGRVKHVNLQCIVILCHLTKSI